MIQDEERHSVQLQIDVVERYVMFRKGVSISIVRPTTNKAKQLLWKAYQYALWWFCRNNVMQELAVNSGTSWVIEDYRGQ